MKICGIYGIKCKTNNKILVGSSKSVYRRYSQHLYNLRRNIHNNKHLQNAFNLYGEDSFELLVFEKCFESELLTREDYWINKTNSLNNKKGFNFKTAERPKLSKEMHKNLSNSKKGSKNPMYGKTLSQQHKDRISKSLKEKKIKRHFTDEARKNMSIAQTGKKLSKETRLKIGLAQKGKKVSKETKQKMSELQKDGKSWNIGRKMPEEQKRKISQTLKGKKKITEEGRKKLSESKTGKNNPMFGKRQSAETIKKRIESRKRNKIAKEILQAR